MEEYAREPCPWRIIDDCGGAFSMGLIGGRAYPLKMYNRNSFNLFFFFFQGGGFFNMLGGAYNAPAGYQRRLLGGIIRVKERWVLYCSSLEVASIFVSLAVAYMFLSLWQWLYFFSLAVANIFSVAVANIFSLAVANGVSLWQWLIFSLSLAVANMFFYFRAPLLGGQFAAWGICFSSFDCTFAHIRGKEVQ